MLFEILMRKGTIFFVFDGKIFCFSYKHLKNHKTYKQEMPFEYNHSVFSPTIFMASNPVKNEHTKHIMH